MIWRKINIVICVISAALASYASATEYTSSSFKVLDPVISIGGGLSTSAAYSLQQSVGQPAIGLSNAASWVVKGGFLYFGDAVTPTATPTPTPTPVGNGPPGSVPPPPPGPPITIPPQPPLPVPIGKCGVADFNCDGVVDITDLSVFLYLTGYSAENNPADLTGSGSIGFNDLGVLFYYWSEPLLFRLPTFAEIPSFTRPAREGGGGGERVIGQGRKLPKFGIQNEEAVSLAKSATSTILALISKIISIITVFITGFLRFLGNVVQLR